MPETSLLTQLYSKPQWGSRTLRNKVLCSEDSSESSQPLGNGQRKKLGPEKLGTCLSHTAKTAGSPSWDYLQDLNAVPLSLNRTLKKHCFKGSEKPTCKEEKRLCPLLSMLYEQLGFLSFP